MDHEIDRSQSDLTSEPFLLNPSFAMIFADLYHGNIKNLDEFGKSLDFYDISRDAGRSFLEDLVKKALLKVEEGQIVVDRNRDWTKLGSNPTQGVHFVPELFQIVSRRGLENRITDTDADKFLNFAAYLNFPGDESVLIKLRTLYTNFYKELQKVHASAKSSTDSSDDIYTVCLASSKLDRGDFQ